MIRPLLTVCLALVCAALGSAQNVGFRTTSFANTTGQGSSSISTRIYYPSTSSGQNAPLAAAPTSGYPVVVFLHGWLYTGSTYDNLGSHLAANGYVAVLNNTGQFSLTLQARDGAALYPALVAANSQPGHFLQGSLDMSNVALSGHSAGGGNTITALASNPGYKMGLSFAPLYPGSGVTNQVDVPFGVIHAQGDAILLWSANGQLAYNEANSFSSHKFNYLFDFSGGHNNITGVLLVTSADQAIWSRSRRVMTGFFDRHLRDDVAQLEEVIGATARAESRLTSLSVEVEVPDLWLTGSQSLGQTTQIHTRAEPGLVFYAAATATAAPTPTPFGSFLLDMSSAVVAYTALVGGNRVGTVSLAIPNNGQFLGTQLAFQSLGWSNGGGYRLTETATLVISN